MKTIAVFFGGKSTEHDISILSANLVINVLKTDYDIVPVYITKNNDFYTGKMDNISVFKNFNPKKFKRITFVKNNIFLLKNKRSKFFKKIDVAIPVLHGKNGEDGAIQGFFRLNDIPFAESDILGSGLTLNKIYTKIILEKSGIPFVDYEVIDKYKDYNANSIIERLGFPLIVKPANLGSSIGISKADNIDEFDKAVELGFMFDSKLIIEKCLTDFKEYNISLLRVGDKIESSLIEQPLSKHEILTFVDKYKTKTGKGMESIDRIFPAEISSELASEITLYGIKAYEDFGLNGVVRIDFLYNGKLYLNEVNSIPGSMAYYLWKDKYTFKKLLEIIIASAEEDFEKNNKLTTYFDGTVL